MEQHLPPPQTGLNVVVTKGPGEAASDALPTEVMEMPVGVFMALTDVQSWLGGIKGAVQQLADDCQRHQRDSGMLAVQRAINGFNEATAALVEKVFELEVLE